MALDDVAGLSWLCLSSVVGFAVYMPWPRVWVIADEIRRIGKG